MVMVVVVVEGVLEVLRIKVSFALSEVDSVV